MRTWFRIGILAVALLPVGGGVAAAYPNVADAVSQYKDVDGWRLRLTFTGVTIESVPNIAATATSREGYVTATVTEEITRPDGDEAPPGTELTGGALELYAVAGCQWKTDSLTISPNEYPVGPTASTSLTLGSGTPPSISVGVQPNSDAAALFAFAVKPGESKKEAFGIDDQPLLIKFPDDKGTMSEGDAKHGQNHVISVEKKRVTMDDCGGPVAIQLEAEGMMSTKQSEIHLTAYGDIYSL